MRFASRMTVAFASWWHRVGAPALHAASRWVQAHAVATAVGAFVAALALWTLGRMVRDRRARLRLDEAARLELDIPTSLHPVIDPDVCIGSGSCLSACPEGDILGMVGGVATLINASHCIGHGRCAAECPVDAIKLVFGSARRGVELPELDGGFQTRREGVYIVGELAGMGLVKNALIQGLQVAAGIKKTLPPRVAGAPRMYDVIIVGAGPAGLAAAAGARAAGMSFAVLEQETTGGAIGHYPRQKLVMTEAVEMPFYGSFGRRVMSKEELTAAFAELTARARIKVHERARVTGIEGTRDDFIVTSSRGELRGRRVVLAIGRRGSPRLLGVPGDDGANVAYRLIDPAQYAGRRVLVVGGGDSAVEAAIQLAEQSTATVRLCYRRPALARCRPLNKQRLDALVARDKVRLFMATEVASVGPDSVALRTVDRSWSLPNDFVIACLGGQLPTELLTKVGVGVRRHDGRRAMPNPSLTNMKAAKRGRYGAVKLAFLGAAIIAGLVAVGGDYYLLPRALRYRAVNHELLKPSGLWGHGVGILASLLMLSNFLYSVRKRARAFKGRGPIAPWLRFHVFVGLMSPLTILFHSAFQWGNQLATSTYVSLVVVVGTGLVGRYIYGWFRLDPDHAAKASALREGLRRSLERLGRAVSAQAHAAGLAQVYALANGAPAMGPAASLFLGRPGQSWRLRHGLAQLRTMFLDSASYRHFRGQALSLRHLEVNQEFHARFKGLMKVWRVLHVLMALGLLFLIGLHVWISVRIGFKWLWS